MLSYVKKTQPGELWYNYFTITDSKYRVCWSSTSSLRLKTLSYSIFQHCQYSGHQEASFELSNATICPQGSILWYSDLAIDNTLQGWKIWEKLGTEWSDFDPNKLYLTFWVPNYHAKFHQNRVGIATAGEVTDRQTDTQTKWFHNLSNAMQ